MPVIRRARRGQPPGAVAVDWANPLTRGLILCVKGAEPVNLANRRLLTPTWGTPRARAARQGVGLSLLPDVSGPGVAYGLVGNEFPNGATQASSLIVFDVLSSGASDADGQTLSSILDTDSNANWTVDAYSNQTQLGVRWYFNDYSKSEQYFSAALAAGERHVDFSCFAAGGTHDVYKNGRLLGAQAVAAGKALGDGSLAHVLRTSTPGVKGTAVVQLQAYWNRALSGGEVASLSANPWQLFRTRRYPIALPVTAQYARPTADVSTGTWVSSLGGALAAALDEAAADDGDYISTTYASICEVALGSLSDPAVSTGHKVRYRLAADSGGITVRLRQGTTTIASWTHDPAPSAMTTFEQTLSGAEADSITDYSALKLQFEATP